MTARPDNPAESRQDGDSDGGYKLDNGKPRWELLPWAEVEDVVKVLTAGLGKYPPNNWQRVPEARRRYFSAAMRHIIARLRGSRLDPDTGLPHLAHACCCLLFWAWHDKEAGDEC